MTVSYPPSKATLDKMAADVTQKFAPHDISPPPAFAAFDERMRGGHGETFVVPEFLLKKQLPVPDSSSRRKAQPLFQGCLMYFPDALLAVAEHSRKANDKHNPGEPLHWSKDKSKDHADCIARHLLDIGPQWDETDPEFDSLHATALAWRALALLQTVLERQRHRNEEKEVAQDRAALGEVRAV